jgi:hypothetical protein
MNKEMFRDILTNALALTDTKEDYKRFTIHFDYALKNLDNKALNIQSEEDIQKIYGMFAQVTNMLLKDFDVKETKNTVFNDIMGDVDKLFMQAANDLNDNLIDTK